MTSDNNVTPQINYEFLVETALRSVVSAALKIAAQNGLPGDTHFYITFLTDHPEVEIPDRLRDSHPEKMTIIIQHQFWDLDIQENHFSIALSFGGKKETLSIPFMAVVEFNDPSVGFGLQFALEMGDEPILSDEDETPPETAQDTQIGGDSADVVSLDSFRKKT